jgi:hypothetical protein
MQIGVAEVRMVEHVGECALHAKPDALGYGEGLADARRQVRSSRAQHRTDLRIAEPSDRQRSRAGSAARGAGRSGLPVRVAGAGEGRGVDPLQACAIGRCRADTLHDVNMLCPVSAIERLKTENPSIC